MAKYEIQITWEGPYTCEKVIKELTDGGNKKNNWDGEDYGVYQIYGKHILCKNNSLLYIGKAFKQTFSRRFKDHQKWLKDEANIKIYVGRIYNPKKHSEKDNWKSWENDVELAENILIYKYSPHYNSRSLSEQPKLGDHKSVSLCHKGKIGKLDQKDVAPDDL